MEFEYNINYLNAKALIGSDLFIVGEITRPECFRLEMDALIGENSGDIQYKKNKDFENNEL